MSDVADDGTAVPKHLQFSTQLPADQVTEVATASQILLRSIIDQAIPDIRSTWELPKSALSIAPTGALIDLPSTLPDRWSMFSEPFKLPRLFDIAFPASPTLDDFRMNVLGDIGKDVLGDFSKNIWSSIEPLSPLGDTPSIWDLVDRQPLFSAPDIQWFRQDVFIPDIKSTLDILDTESELFINQVEHYLTEGDPELDALSSDLLESDREIAARVRYTTGLELFTQRFSVTANRNVRQAVVSLTIASLLYGLSHLATEGTQQDVSSWMTYAAFVFSCVTLAK